MKRGRFGRLPPSIRTPPPGPRSLALADRLRRVESRNVTYLGDEFPVFWEEARGANVRDVDGNVYVDLTGAFGVALIGHGRPEIERAVAEQMKRLVHGMGDVHPPAPKVELLERFNAILPWHEARTVLVTGGAEAVEVALKTALLATGRPGIVSFHGAYHGLTQGALSATARAHFRDPFRARVYGGTVFLPYPQPGGGPTGGASSAEVLDGLERALAEGAPNGDPIGAVIIEPIQARGGLRIPPEGFLRELGERTRAAGVLVVADEIFTGLGRTGAAWASTEAGLEPDLLCVGKALGGGFPLYACTGPVPVMDAWPESRGEAIHTSTFLGHPASCAAGLAFLDLLQAEDIPGRARELGERIRESLDKELAGVPGVVEIRGRGLMQGVELGVPEGGRIDGDRAGRPSEAGRPSDEDAERIQGLGARVASTALEGGVLVLPAGDRGNVVELTPPTVLTEEQLEIAVAVLGRAIRRVLRAAVTAVLFLGLLGPGAEAQEGPAPVLLVPGWADGPAELGALRTRFIEAGWPPGHVRSVSFQDPVGSNREHAEEVASALRALGQATGAPMVDVVAHSMGGLALREYMRRRAPDGRTSPGALDGVGDPGDPGTAGARSGSSGPPALRRVVFLATPHRGTVAAFIARGEGGDEMRPGSSFLEILNADSIPPSSVEFLSVHTPLDLSVVPNESAKFFQAGNVRNVEVCCPSHSGLLDDDKTFEEVVDFLLE